MGIISVVLLLPKQQDVNQNSQSVDSLTSLMIAAENRHKSVVRLLLEEEGANVESRKKALRLAARARNEAVVELLKKRIKESLSNLGLQHLLEKPPTSGIRESSNISRLQLDTLRRFI
jgi:ankyrin repeat protein